MKTSIHNDLVRFRASDALIAKARAKANREGMSLSELLRQAVRHELEAA